jgi:membrane protein DedA with SNARE-associated domain
MAFWRFQLATVASVILWSASLLLLGAVGWDAIKATWFWLGGWPSIAVGAAAILLAFLFRDRIKSAWRQLPR